MHCHNGMASNLPSTKYKNYNFCVSSVTFCLLCDLGVLIRCVFTGPSVAHVEDLAP